MYSRPNPHDVAGMSRMVNRKVYNMHARDECIVNVSAASKMLMPWG